MFINQIPGYFLIIKDTKYTYQGISRKAANLIGFKSEEAVLGLTDYDIKCKAVELASHFVRLDGMAIKYGLLKSIGYICYSNDDWKIMLAERNVFKNSENKPVGLTSCIIEVTDCNLVDIARFLLHTDAKGEGKKYKEQFSYVLDNVYLEANLTSRLSECLFFLIRGKSAKVIAKILSISPRTVEGYIEEIRHRLGCENKSELI